MSKLRNVSRRESSDESPISALDGVAVITGGCGGIGSATAREILRSSPRARCALVDLTEGESGQIGQEFGSERVIYVRSDVSDDEAVLSAFEEVVKWHSPITMLVNSAGNQVKAASFELSAADWHRVLGVHLDGTFFWCQRVGRHMADNGGGTIVNVASVSMYFALPRRIAYSCAKAAVGALTRTLAVEWADYGIRVNAVAPGWVNTPLASQALTQNSYDAEAARNEHALKRFGEPEEVARLIGFLLSETSSFVTGTVINIDGGYTSLKGS